MALGLWVLSLSRLVLGRVFHFKTRMIHEEVKKNIDLKKETVEKLASKIAGSSAVVFTDYKGLNMTQLNELRNKLYDIGAEYNITKNTLVNRSLAGLATSSKNETLEGPTATLFSNRDAVEAVKALFAFTRTNQSPKVKFGLFDGNYVDANALEAISKLPGKAELIGQVVGSVGGPLYGLVGTLNGSLVALVMTLKSLEVQKGGE